MQRKIFDVLLFFLHVVSSGAFLTLWKEGGARAEGISNFEEYKGPLVLMPYAWSTAVFLAVVLLLGKPKIRDQFFISLKKIWHLPAVAIFSIMWADDPFEATKAALPLSAGVLLLVSSCAISGALYTLQLYVKILIFCTLMSFFYCLFIPSYGIALGIHEGAWQGVYAHKNFLGSYSLITMIFCILLGDFSSKDRATYYRVFAVLAAALAALSQSTAALVGVVVAVVVRLSFKLLPQKASFGFWRSVALWVFVVSVSCSVLIVLSSIFMPSVPILGKDSSYSGRDRIWVFFFGLFLLKPIFGYGIGQLTSVNNSFLDFISIQVGFTVSHPHNGFIEALFNFGLIGFAAVLNLFRSMIEEVSDAVSAKIFILMVPSVVFLNTFEARFVTFNPVYFVMLIAYLTSCEHNFYKKLRSI